MADESTLSRFLLEKVIEDEVSKSLGKLGQRINEFVGNFPEADKQAARTMALEMIKDGCEAFCRKANARIVKDGEKSKPE